MSVIEVGTATVAPTLPIATRNAIAHDLGERLRDEVERLEPSDERQWWRVAETDEYDAWLIDWPPGAIVPRHDHDGAAASIVVLRGALVETRFDTANVATTSVVTTGRVHVVGDEVSHEIGNAAQSVATSVHVYSPPLRAMSFLDDDGSPTRRDVVDPSYFASPA